MCPHRGKLKPKGKTPQELDLGLKKKKKQESSKNETSSSFLGKEKKRRERKGPLTLHTHDL
jgi:hypothetical protein